MLRKKLNKIFSVFVAVIIAASSFCLSASAEEQPTFDFENFTATLESYVFICDSEGNVIDSITIYPEQWNYNKLNNAYYLDIKAPSNHKFFENGEFVAFGIMSSLEFSSLEYLFVIDFEDNVYVDYSINDSIGYGSFFKANDCDCFVFVEYSDVQEPAISAFSSTKPLSTLSLAFAPVPFDFEGSESGEVLYYFDAPTLYPGIFDFHSDMGTFFKSCVSWVSSIGSNVLNNPPLLVLFIGFVTVGFVFGLLRRLSHS